MDQVCCGLGRRVSSLICWACPQRECLVRIGCGACTWQQACSVGATLQVSCRQTLLGRLSVDACKHSATVIHWCMRWGWPEVLYGCNCLISRTALREGPDCRLLANKCYLPSSCLGKTTLRSDGQFLLTRTFRLLSIACPLSVNILDTCSTGMQACLIVSKVLTILEHDAWFLLIQTYSVRLPLTRTLLRSS